MWYCLVEICYYVVRLCTICDVVLCFIRHVVWYMVYIQAVWCSYLTILREHTDGKGQSKTECTETHQTVHGKYKARVCLQ